MLLINAEVNLTHWCSHMSLIKEESYVSSLMTYHMVCNQKLGTAYPSGESVFIPCFQWCLCMFCGSLFVLLSFFFQPLCCMSFFDLRILITPLVSSKTSYLRCASQLCNESPVKILSRKLTRVIFQHRHSPSSCSFFNVDI